MSDAAAVKSRIRFARSGSADSQTVKIQYAAVLVNRTAAVKSGDVAVISSAGNRSTVRTGVNSAAALAEGCRGSRVITGNSAVGHRQRSRIGGIAAGNQQPAAFARAIGTAVRRKGGNVAHHRQISKIITALKSGNSAAVACRIS